MMDKGLSYDSAILKQRQVRAKILSVHLELLLALLRTREAEDLNFKKLLSPNTEITQKFLKLIQDISELFAKYNLNLSTRILLDIHKPDYFHNTPDLLYALGMYLSGDTGANTIVIKEVKDSN